MYETAKDFIATLGFPIFVSVYLLTRFEKKLEMLLEEHKQANTVLSVLMKVLTTTGPVITPPPFPAVDPDVTQDLEK